MKNNQHLKNHVQDAIKLQVFLNEADIIGVIAKDGVIILKGIVDSYAKKSEVENVTKNVKGVKAVVDHIEINFGSTDEKSDSEIASEVLNALKVNPEVSDNKIKIIVENGHVTLEGELPSNYQKEAAKNSVRNLGCIKALKNEITIKSETP